MVTHFLLVPLLFLLIKESSLLSAKKSLVSSTIPISSAITALLINFALNVSLCSTLLIAIAKESLFLHRHPVLMYFNLCSEKSRAKIHIPFWLYKTL